jgi:hypothetical protein
VPRMDVIGNQGQVAWPQLVDQIATGVRNGIQTGAGAGP